jgi:hypothetical protein
MVSVLQACFSSLCDFACTNQQDADRLAAEFKRQGVRSNVVAVITDLSAAIPNNTSRLSSFGVRCSLDEVCFQLLCCSSFNWAISAALCLSLRPVHQRRLVLVDGDHWPASREGFWSGELWLSYKLSQQQGQFVDAFQWHEAAIAGLLSQQSLISLLQLITGWMA